MMSNYLELVKLLFSWPVVVLVIFFIVLFKSRHLNVNALVTKVVDRISKLSIRDVIVELREKVNEQQTQIAVQRTMIDEQDERLRKIVAFSMSFHIYKPLKELYHKSLSSNPAEEYLYRTYQKRDFYFLRDHGYIESQTPVFLDIEKFQHKQNLLGVVKLTKAGEFYVNLREQLEAEKSSIAAFQEQEQ